ncbi:MAG: F0F1 ATP synthase subunit delta [Jiangellaceae bacterium]
MRGRSRQAYAEFGERLDAAVGRDGRTAQTIGEALFGFAGLLRDQPAVRRALTDPGRSGDDRAGLVRALVGDQLDPAAVELIAAGVRERWAGPGDLMAAIEEFGVAAHLAGADREGRLDDVEDELFRFGQVVQGEPALRAALLDQAAPAESRRELVRTLLADRAEPVTVRLVEQVVLGRRDRTTVEAALNRVGELAARQRRRRVAVVRVAAPLTTGHRERLEQALATHTGGPVHLNVVVEPDLVGGVKVEMGDEVVDGTVRSRLADVERRLSGR